MRIQLPNDEGGHRQTNPSSPLQDGSPIGEKGFQKINPQVEKSDTNSLHDSKVQTGAEKKLLGKSTNYATTNCPPHPHLVLLLYISYRVFCLMGDGEMSEGAVWEAMSFASYYQLDNLVAIMDINRLGQSDSAPLQHHVEKYQKRCEAFG